MKSFINPTYHNIWGSEKPLNSATNEEYMRSTHQKSRWERFKYWVSEVCETLKPMIEIIIPVVRTVSTVVNAFCNIRNCKYRKGNATCAA